jgi:hypothetical protein
VTGYVVALRCLKEGGANGVTAKNIGSQIVDAMIATYATYFDGFLSDDKRALQTYDMTCDLLKIYHRDILAEQRTAIAITDHSKPFPDPSYSEEMPVFSSPEDPI